MDETNIYIAVTGNGPARQHIAGQFIVEIVRNEITFTYPTIDKDTFIYAEAQTPARLTAMLLTNAIIVLNKLILYNQMPIPESVSVFIDKPAADPFIKKWYERWYEDNYIRKDGKALEEAHVWEQLNGVIRNSSTEYRYYTDSHSYSNIMHGQARKYLADMLEKKNNESPVNNTVERS